MQFTTALLGLLAAAGTSLAAPAPQSRQSPAQWTIALFTRTCNAEDTSCYVAFGINAGSGTRGCFYNVTGAPASQASVANVACGQYIVGSGWSNAFPPNGFTTWSVADWGTRQIVFPSYSDRDLINGVPVKPDRSFPTSPL